MIFNGIEFMGWITAALAIAGVILNNRMDRNCFWLWMVSNLISAGIHVVCGVWSLVVRDVVFFALAIYGLRSWTAKQKKAAAESLTTAKLLQQNVQLTALLNKVRKQFKC